MKTLRTALVALAAVSIPAPLLAHEGHGFEGTVASLIHWLSSPYHILLTAVILAVAVAVPLVIRRATETGRTDVPRRG